MVKLLLQAKLLWLFLLLVALFSILHLYRTTPGWVDSGSLSTAWSGDRDWALNNDVRVHWDSQSAQLSLHHSHSPAWASTPGRPWVNVIHGSPPDLRSLSSGRLGRNVRGCQDQFWFDSDHSAERLVLHGNLTCDGESVRAILEISAADPDGLQLEWSLDAHGALQPTGLMLEFELPADEPVYGFGQQTGSADHQGRRLVLNALSTPTRESGFGPGTLWPVGLTAGGRALVADNEAHQVLDLRDGKAARLEVWDAHSGRLRILLADEPRQLLRQLAEVVGTMPGLPDALHRRAVLGTSRQGRDLIELLDALAREETPLGAVLLEMPQRDGFPVSGDVMPWRPGRFETGQADWSALTARLEADGLALLGSRNPLFQSTEVDNLTSDPTAFPLVDDPDVLLGSRRIDRNLEEGVRMRQLDLQRDAALAWLDDYSAAVGSGILAGWVTDWYTPPRSPDARPDSERLKDELAAGRRWQDWQLGRAMPVISRLEPWPEQPAGARSGMVATGHHATAWGPSTGLQASLAAMLSGGVSGLTVAHSPVGGTWTSNRLWWPRHRDPELFLRWLELSTFTGWMRLHEGDQPARHYQVTDSVSGRVHFDRLARLYEVLFPYRRNLMREASEQGWPLVRPLWFTFPEDERTWTLPPDQFMFGDHLLVVPALASGVTEREFYLPAGDWTHLWDGRTFESTGETRRLRTPIGEPLVLVHADFPYRESLRARAAELAIGNILGAH